MILENSVPKAYFGQNISEISKVGSRKSEMESRKTLLVSAFVFCSPLLFAACKSAGEQSASLQLVYSSYMIPIVYRYIVSLDR